MPVNLPDWLGHSHRTELPVGPAQVWLFNRPGRRAGRGPAAVAAPGTGPGPVQAPGCRASERFRDSARQLPLVARLRESEFLMVNTAHQCHCDSITVTCCMDLLCFHDSLVFGALLHWQQLFILWAPGN